MVRAAGLLLSVAYAVLIGWLYTSQPQTGTEALGGLAASVGVYQVNEQAFEDGLSFFRADKFPESRLAFQRADPAHRDARTRFYVAYSYYRQGWGRLSNDDTLFKQGLDEVNRAIELAPDHRLVVADDTLGMRSADELKVELERGLQREFSDLNPLRIFGPRK